MALPKYYKTINDATAGQLKFVEVPTSDLAILLDSSTLSTAVKDEIVAEICKQLKKD